MEIKKIETLLIKTAFCFMISDDNIDKSEISLIKSMCEKSKLFENFDFVYEINVLVNELNSRGKDFIKDYFDLLKSSKLTEEEEESIIDFAINTILADERIEYSEIKTFKAIRGYIRLTDEKILEAHPNVSQFLEKDIIEESLSDNIKQYFDSIQLPKFELITPFDTNSLKGMKLDE